MEFNEFKDILFDLMNESDEMNVAEIRTFDKENRFELVWADGTEIALSCRIKENSKRADTFAVSAAPARGMPHP